MTRAPRSPTHPAYDGAVVPLRRHVATVRSLLDEFERVLSEPGALGHAEGRFAVCEQLVEELGRIGGRLLECAAASTAAAHADTVRPPSSQAARLSDAGRTDAAEE